MVYETTSSRVGVPEVFSVSRERERRNPAAWTMQQKCCNNTRRSLPASPDTIRYYLYTFHPPPDRPTDQPTTIGLEMSKREPARSDIIIIIHIAITQRTNPRSIHQLHQYLPDVFSVRDETYLTYLTSPHLTFLGSHPKRKLPH